MSQTESGAAEQMVGWGIKALEAISRLSASGAKNLAVFVAAWAKSNRKNRGKTTLGRMLRDGKELKVFQIDKSRLREFAHEARRHGVLFTAIRDNKTQGDQIDLMVRAEDASKINRIIEKMSLATRDVATVQTQPAQANPTQARNGRRLFSRSKPRPSVRYSTRNESTGAIESSTFELKPSVRANIRQLQRLRDERRKQMAAGEVVAPPTNVIQPQPAITQPQPPPRTHPQLAVNQQPVMRGQSIRSNAELSREMTALIAHLQGVLSQIEQQPEHIGQPAATQDSPSPLRPTVERSSATKNGTRQQTPDDPFRAPRSSVRDNISQIRASRSPGASKAVTPQVRMARPHSTTKGR